MLRRKEQGLWTITGTTRDKDKRILMRAHGVRAHIFDSENPLIAAREFLHGCTHVLISVPPGDDGDPAFSHHIQDILATPSIKWVGYLSSTAVYGDRDGGWVDETMDPHPNSKRGTRRAMAESQWLSAFANEGLPVHIFRLAGIYGPGRSALDSVRAGVARRIDKPGHAFSRIHVADIVNVLTASMERPNPGAVYNVADDEAAPSHEVIAYACELLGLQPPPLVPFAQAELAPMARSFYSDNKRIHNDRIKSELGVVLKHPDYKSGLRACLEAEGTASTAIVQGGGVGVG